jgi:O-Antigen ligase
MTSATTLLRSLIVYGLCLPLAAFLGYLLATPLDFTTFLIVGFVLFVMVFPLFLRWHHPWMIACWNMSAVLFFLPGHPPLWMCLAGMSLLISVLQFAINRERRFLSVPSLTWPLILLAVVVVITAKLTGGVGIRTLGSEFYGGKRYVLVLSSILAYFAFTSRTIPAGRGTLYVVLFFLGSATMAMSTLAGTISPSFNFLFLIFPPESVTDLTQSVVGDPGFIIRPGGLSVLGTGVFCALLAKYNLQGIFDARNPLKLLALLAFIFISLLGGYRSVLVIFMLTLFLLFCLEGLFRSRMLPVAVLALVLGSALLAAFAIHLPLSVQRSLALLPINIDPEVKMNAEFSNEWRLRMWREVIPEIPQYLLVGKGYGFSAVDMDIAYKGSRSRDLEGSELSVDYHSGPLSVILPLGLFGAIFFFWFLGSCIRVMYLNFKFGDPSLQRLNTFLLAYFLAKTVFFCAVFGSLYVDLTTFVGLVGLSVSLNGGVAKPVRAPEPQIMFQRSRLAPVVRRPVGV